MARLEGKVAIVTGGARGLGGGAVDALHAEGASVVIADVLDDTGQARAATLGERGLYHHLDVRDAAQWALVVEQTIDRWGRIDCLVNNAGINIPIDIEAATLEQFQSILDVNLLGAFLGIKAVLPTIRENGGSIINVASNSTSMALPETSLYGASKSGLANLTKTTAVHCGLKGYPIRCNSIHPGMHLTEMIDNPQVQALPHVRALKNAIPMGRMGMPEEFGKLVAFLASDDSSYMTAAELFTDGGLTVVSFADPSRG